MSHTEASESLGRCLRRGRSEDWNEFVKRHGWRIKGTIRQAVLECGLRPAGLDLDEIVQDLYCRLIATPREGFRGGTEREVWSYVRRAAYNLLVDRKRRRAAAKRRVNSFCECERDAVRHLRMAATPEPSPEERVLETERRKLFLQRCFEVVRADRVRVELKALGLALLGGWTSGEVARKLRGRLSAGQVDLLVYKLRRHLRADGIHLPRRASGPSAQVAALQPAAAS